MTRLLALLILVSSLTAAAQTVVLPQISLRRVTDLNVETYTFGAGQCNDTLTVQWTNTTAIQFVTQCSSNAMKVWSSASECGTTPGSSDLRYDDIPGLTLQTIKQGTFAVKIAELPGFSNTLTTDGGVVTCGTEGLTKTHRICANIEYSTFTGVACGTATNTSASPLKLVYDTQPPTAPTIGEYTAQDQGVKVAFTTDSDTTNVQLEVRAAGDVDYRQIADAAAANKVVIGKGLMNNTTYDVRLRAVDGAGNVSDPSSAVAITPIKTLGFFGYYRAAGGTDAGCSTGSGLLAVLGLGFLWRRRSNGNKS